LENKLYQPNELAKTCGINKNTLNHYLSDTELFPPIKIDENNSYRYYDDSAVLKLHLLRGLRKKPFRLTIAEIKPVLKKEQVRTLYKLWEKAGNSLYDFLKEKNYL
jgi:DNA-binding transcriptional MerR regulator